MKVIEGKFNTAKVFTDHCDQATVAQVTNLLNQSCVQGSQIRIMPDYHAGAGRSLPEQAGRGTSERGAEG